MKILQLNKEGARRKGNPACFWTGRINTVKMAMLSKAIHGFNEIPMKILKTYLTEIGKIFRIYIETQNTMHSDDLA